MENKAKDFFLRIKEFLNDKKKKSFLIILLGCFGMILILLSEFISDVPKEETKESYASLFNSKEKEDELESRLSEAISKIKGAGKTEVMITIESSKELFFEKNSEESKNENESEINNELVILNGEKEDTPVLFKTNEEKIRGVLVICEGGGNPVVCEKIIKSVCALLDIPSTKVSVAEMAL